MSSFNIVAIAGNGFMQAAMRQLLKNYIPENAIVFKTSLEECINGKSCPKYLIVEYSSLPQPQVFSLEKITNKNPDGKILIIESGLIDLATLPFVKEVIRLSDNENIVNNKLKQFFTSEDKIKNVQADNTISDREKEIVKLVALGKTNKEISDELFISPHTVITHRKNITSKLGIKTIAGLTVYAILNNILDTDEALE